MRSNVLFLSAFILVLWGNFTKLYSVSLIDDKFIPVDESQNNGRIAKLIEFIGSDIALISFIFFFSLYYQTPNFAKISTYVLALIFFAHVVFMILLLSHLMMFSLDSLVNFQGCNDPEELIPNSFCFEKANALLCSVDCQCNDRRLINTSNYSQDGAMRVQDCPHYFDYLSNCIEYNKIWQEVEETQNCTGICWNQNSYTFSDINRGVPENVCLDVFVNHLETSYKNLDILIFCGTWLVLIALILAIFALCDSKTVIEEERDKNMENEFL